MINVLITTKHRGVFAARATDATDLTAEHITSLKDVKMVVRWRNLNGLPFFAKHGPTDKCKVSDSADAYIVRDVTAVFAISNEAASKIWRDDAE